MASIALSPSPSPSLAPTTTTVLSDVRSINADEWEKERSALYQQLDEKVIDLTKHMSTGKLFFFCTIG